MAEMNKHKSEYCRKFSLLWSAVGFSEDPRVARYETNWHTNTASCCSHRGPTGRAPEYTWSDPLVVACHRHNRIFAARNVSCCSQLLSVLLNLATLQPGNAPWATSLGRRGRGGHSSAGGFSKYQQHKHSNRIINNRVINNSIIKENNTFTNLQWISLRKNIGKIFSKQNKLPMVVVSQM